MPIGPGGHGGHGGHGGFGGPGPGSPGAHGPGGGRGPGRGGPGRGGPGGIFAHFGPNSNGSASGGKDAGFLGAIFGFSGNQFPENAVVQNPAQAQTGLERVDLFIINANSIERAAIWLACLSIVLATLTVLSGALLAPNTTLIAYLILFNHSALLSPFVYATRDLISHYGRVANYVTLIMSITCILGAIILALTGSGSPRAFIAYGIAFFISSHAHNFSSNIARRSQEIRGFDDNARSYYSRTVGANVATRIVELIVFVPFAFIGRMDGFSIFWQIVCSIAVATVIDFIILIPVSGFRSWLVYHLSADNDCIVDE